MDKKRKLELSFEDVRKEINHLYSLTCGASFVLHNLQTLLKKEKSDVSSLDVNFSSLKQSVLELQTLLNDLQNNKITLKNAFIALTSSQAYKHLNTNRLSANSTVDKLRMLRQNLMNLNFQLIETALSSVKDIYSKIRDKASAIERMISFLPKELKAFDKDNLKLHAKDKAYHNKLQNLFENYRLFIKEILKLEEDIPDENARNELKKMQSASLIKNYRSDYELSESLFMTLKKLNSSYNHMTSSFNPFRSGVTSLIQNILSGQGSLSNLKSSLSTLKAKKTALANGAGTLATKFSRVNPSQRALEMQKLSREMNGFISFISQMFNNSRSFMSSSGISIKSLIELLDSFENSLASSSFIIESELIVLLNSPTSEEEKTFIKKDSKFLENIKKYFRKHPALVTGWT